VIDDEEFAGHSGHHQFQPELLLHCGKNRRAAGSVRGHCGRASIGLVATER
jgi:hypothetical protein